ncbi:MAG: type II toxin-antitoxin system Phd/YefM family antitoxin [Propionibacteriaceae bacterium]|jgi:antitoxin (DNA-binding transcriptional repressor) of toxin-antitoxin stability system|nr:type II toxin-antitoxin system Phd/YefM family antitoxin [Propionibacteriaceae bacterium]
MTTVGVREFRADLASYIESSEPVEVTRHGQLVGYFLPVRRPTEDDLAAYDAAVAELDEAIQGLDKEEMLAEFDSLRKHG